MSITVTPDDKRTLNDIRDAVLGPTGAAKVTRDRPVIAASGRGRGPVQFLGLAKISDIGADSDHWKWSFSLRNTSDGTFTTQTTPSSNEWGECVIANGIQGAIGMAGELFYQHGTDGTLYIVMIPVSVLPAGNYIGTVYQTVSTNTGGFDFIHTHAELA